MPKSKRSKVVHLTQTKKKTKDWKEGLVTKVRDAAEKYPSCYLFKHFNMRTEPFKQLREELHESTTIIMGSCKVMQVALGRSESDEVRTDIHKLSERLKGYVGLFFTTLSREEVEKVVSEFKHEDFARAGAKCLSTFALPEGPLDDINGVPLQHTMEPQLRKLGMPTKLNKGVVELAGDFTVCKEGRILDANQAAILKVFGIKMAVLRLKLLAAWTEDAFEELADGDDDDEEDGEEEDEEMLVNI
ncbi:hypothetical protein FOA52_010402 [Chlamydomonas sp. UWO 241]|nr:hypothetical protein FOA52_010402 [Chlamydomonas sp. UWO 241]